LKASIFLKMVARPWVDPVCLWGLKRIFPASRAWAAAGMSQGDPDRFADELDCSRVPAIAKRLKKTVDLKRKSDAAFARWDETVFGGNGDAAAVEEQRRAAAQNWFSHRFTYLMFARRHGLPPVRLEVPTPQEVMDEFAASLSEERERVVWREHLAAEEPVSLGEIGARFGVSKQRMGQIADQLKKRFRAEIVEKLGPDVRTDWLGAESD